MLNGELTHRSNLIGELTGGVFYGTNDYEELINKPSINGVELKGNKTTSDLGINIPTELSELTNDVGFITSADVPTKTSDLTNDSGYITSADVSAVGLSGDYDDLTNKPTIPTLTSQLTNDSGFITNASVPTMTSQLFNDSGYITSADIPTDVSAFTNDAGYITSSDIPTDVSAFTNDAGYISNSDLMTATASGSIATFSNGGNDIPVSEFECEIVAQQASGTPTPDNPLAITGHSESDIVVCGKNLLNATISGIKAINTSGVWNGNVYTYANMTFTLEGEGDTLTGIKVNGTSNNSYGYFYLSKSFYAKQGETYSISGSPSGKSTSTFRIFCDSNLAFGAGNRLSDDNDTDKTRTANATEENVEVFIQVFAGIQMTNAYFYPQIELGQAISAYHAYTGNLYTVAFGQTIYGGRLIYNGEWSIEVTHEVLDLGSLDWISETGYVTGLFRAGLTGVSPSVPWSEPFICSCFTYSSTHAYTGIANGEVANTNTESVPILRARWEDYQNYTNAQFKSAMSGQYILCPITPTIIPITSSTRVKTISGDNNIYSNTGDCELKYFTDKADNIAELIKAFL